MQGINAEPLTFAVIIRMILKLWCKGTNKRECYNGINAEPLTTVQYKNDTFSFILQEVSFFYLIICQSFIFTFSKKNDTLRLFHKKTFFVRAHTQRYIQKVSDIKSYRYKKIHHDVNFNAKKIRIIVSGSAFIPCIIQKKQ